MTQAQRNPTGRPTDYDADFHPQDLIRLATLGKSVAHCCANWGICRKTFYNWAKCNPEFLHSYARAREIINAFWIDKAEDGVTETGNESGYTKTNQNVLKMLWGANQISSDDRAIIIPGFSDAATDVGKRNCVLDALGNGDITPGEADRFLAVLERGLKIGEATELLERLAKLEEASGVAA